ncbi:NYN domain-containing protein [Bacterioplanoides pacificum]|uniref:NYN domain-containing protein n=1 Tax=Bacterioplanoides pacificum TaxID=1171596 RepID=A0ABV7VRF9_9GAMM
MKKIAFLVDGGYFIRRVKYFHRTYFNSHQLTVRNCNDLLYQLVQGHQTELNRNELYRIYYYDAPPLDKQLRYPLPLAGQQTPPTRNCKSEESYKFQTQLHKTLAKSRKLALRMGKLSNHGEWQINSLVLKDLLKGDRNFEDLTNDDFHYQCQQKAVDTKIGVDITTITLNKHADTIVLIASDADFVPAAKLARTHGVDVVLDPLWGNVDADLETHIDGKKSFDIVSKLKSVIGSEPDSPPSWWQNS